MTPARRLLLAILFVALAVRLWGLGFGLPYIVARPDEPQIAGPAVGFLSGNLRPPFLQWPTLFAYATALVYVVYFFVTRPFAEYQTLAAFGESRRHDISPFLYVTRGLSVAMGVLTVWWVYGICRRAFDETVAIVAALFLALSFLHVRDSHFGVTDITMTALVTLAVLLIVRWQQTGGLGAAAAAGFAGGLAASTKYNGLGVGVPFLVALALRVYEERSARDGLYRPYRQAVFATLAFGAGMALGLFGTSPYILIDWSRFVTDIGATQETFRIGHGLVVGRGWWYYADTVLPAGVGWPIFFAGVAGAVVLLVTRFRESAVVLAFPIAYYVFAGRGYAVFARYILPVVPFLCISAAWLVVAAVRGMAGHAEPATQRTVLAIAAVAMVWPTARNTVLLDRLLATTDNRIVAARALTDIVSPDSFVCQSGETYGHVPLGIDGRPAGRGCGLDPATGRFRPEDPDFVLVQRSPLVLYSSVPSWLDRELAERYVLVRRFPVDADDSVARVYDQQDAFYLPLTGLEGIRRPGPAFDLYKKTVK